MLRSFFRYPPVLLLFPCMLFPSDALAQAVTGRVLDAASRLPVSAVEILLLSDTTVVTRGITDDSGRFILKADRAGEFRVRATRIGYAPADAGMVRLSANGTSTVEIRLTTTSVKMEAVLINATPVNAYLDMVGFYQRKRTGAGRFLDPSWIEKRNASRINELLEGVPGVRVIRWQHEKYKVALRGGTAATFRVKGDGACYPKVFLNGLPQPDYEWDIHPDAIAAIEIFRSMAEIPAQYGGAESMCGVILIWLKTGAV